MKKIYLLFLALISLFFVACDSNNDTDGDWAKSLEFAGGNRVCAVSFTDPETGDVFIGMGLNSTLSSVADQNVRDFWKYNGSSWTKVTDFPAEGRYGSVAFVIDGIAYIGAGFRGAYADQPDDKYYSDFYMYDIKKNEWLSEENEEGETEYKTIDIQDFEPNHDDCAFSNGIAFTQDGKGYVGTGKLKDRVSKTIYCFDPKTGKWSDAAFPGDSRTAAVTFTIDNKTVICLGSNGTENRTDVIVFENGQWSIKEPLADRNGKWNDDYNKIPRSHAIAFTAVDGNRTYGYIAGGTGNNTCWEYNIVKDRWDEVTKFPVRMSMRLGAVGFSYGNYGYITTGGTSPTNSTDNSTWVFIPGIDEDDNNDY